MRHKSSIPVTTFLIGLTILIITAFQAYWLRKNYREEKVRFTSYTNGLFRATILRLQASKLKLDTNIRVHITDRSGIIGISNELNERIRDSTVHLQPARRTMFLALDGAPGEPPPYADYRMIKQGPERKVFEFLAGVDSLREPITVKELEAAFLTALLRQRPKIDVPFSIQAVPADTSVNAIPRFPEDLESNTITIGFTKPISYTLSFENNTWYLLKCIIQPILISVCLLGVTVLSFVLLYRNLQQQRKLSQLKNDFISNITHELKTPIATVSVAIEALRDFDALEDLQRTNEYLEISANEMKRLSTLVDKVLKLSMFEHREITLTKEPLDLSELARGVLASMRLQFEARHATTHLKTTGRNFIITADKLHITSVLYNLLDNALKYTVKDPEITVHIIDHQQYLEIRVSDNGMGIAKEYKKKIFEKFFRIPSGNRHNTKGYGLGLSYVSHIVQSHMGFITVESEVNKGSTFSIILPFTEASLPYPDKDRRIAKLNTGYDGH